MTNEDILRIALAQSAVDMNCRPDDFCKSENVIVQSVANDGARKYLQLPFECNLVSYGNNIVASAAHEFVKPIGKYISSCGAYQGFETPNLYEVLKDCGLRVCFMAEYFLPDVNLLKVLPCKYDLKLIERGGFENLYLDEWSNALCKDRKNLDILAVGAYDGDKLIGLAGCSADCKEMWQIGVDVLPEYRRRGIAAALTSRLAKEIFERGKVPFYCAAWSNIKSVRNAICCGFRPAWVELTAKKQEITGIVK
ncbi:MAG: GNAT family N-acetyltransferase [Clostridia bacterium]|nr:GNAT family N-acetyltransferase [Clostridia bacterium]